MNWVHIMDDERNNDFTQIQIYIDEWLDEYDEEIAFLEESWRICSPPKVPKHSIQIVVENGIPRLHSPLLNGNFVWMDGQAHEWDESNSVYIPMATPVPHEWKLPQTYIQCDISDIQSELTPVTLTPVYPS